MNEIEIIAQAVLANCRVLEALIAKLPDQSKVAVAAEVAKATPVPAAVQAPATVTVTEVAAPAPTVAPVAPAPIPAAPVMATPTPVAPAVPVMASPSNGMPPPPFPGVSSAPHVEPAPVVIPDECPIKDRHSLTQFMIAAYQRMGNSRSEDLRLCMEKAGAEKGNVNKVTEAMYEQVWRNVLALG